MSEAARKVEEIMEKIRREAKAEVEANGSGYPRHQATAVKQDDKPTTSVLYSAELNYLNGHWHQLDRVEEVSSHRKIIGPIIVKIKSFFLNLIWKHALKNYFKREQEFHMNLVNFLNANARYIDAKNAESFWQLVEKVDNDVVALNDRMDVLFDELRSSFRQHRSDLDKQIDVLTAQVNYLQAELDKTRK